MIEYPSLKALPLYKFYQELDDYDKTTSANTSCQEIIGNRYLNGSKYIKLCQKLSNLLLSINDISARNKKDASTACSYLSYWLYDKLMQIDPTASDIDAVHHVIGKVYNSLESSQQCYYQHYNKCSKDEFEIIKKLHDYAQAFNEIQEVIHTNGVGTTQQMSDYCLFIADGVGYYNSVIQKYGNCYKSNDYCEELKTFKESFDKITLSALTCKYRIPLAYPADKEVDNVVHLYGSDAYSSEDYADEGNSLFYNFFFGYLFSSENLGRFLITSMGSAMLTLLLYKFTPLKFWINSYLRKRKKQKWRNVVDEFQEDYMADDAGSSYEYADGSTHESADGSTYESADGSTYESADGSTYESADGSYYGPADGSNYAQSHTSLSEYPDESSSVYTEGSMPESFYDSSYQMGYSPPRYS
ncbi:hypothetical protein PVBG_05922 [Plasmodium vivax Brazil I]|uniref:VIR protein n=1 Tax=Plasmodium vivax (strain Brazil I) TaxID=1033975 RepID=A0A0J9SK30_PLAV1|nr:hypothetical protein PVBG_05922 [Plasmodium vivax Brazil I]